MAIRNFNVEHGLSIDNGNITVVDSNANVFANTLISNHIISTSGTNSNITINPDGTGVIDVSNKKISNLADPVYASDAATKGYVDATAQGLSIKNSVQYATTTNILLDGSVTTIDGKTVTTGDRVLVKDQTDKSNNGIYVASTTSVWVRSLDMNIASEIYGAFTFVETGTKNQSTGWVTTNSPLDPFTLNTTDISWTQFSGTGSDISTGVDTLHVTGGTTNYVLAAKDNTGNVQFANIANYFLVKTDIATVVAGSTLAFTIDYANTQYPGGIYTLQQLGPVSMTMSDQWSQSGSNIGTSKNSYANYVAGTTNLANVTLTFNLANANFDIKSTDNLTIGSTVFSSSSSPNITTLLSSLTGNPSGTVTIPAGNLATGVEYNGLSSITNTVNANLTNNRGSTGAGVSQVTGTTLTSVAPIPFNVTSLTGSYPTNPIVFFSPSQTLSWNVGLTSGATTITAGNISYSNSSHSISGTLTTTGTTSGTISLNSTYTYSLSTSDYAGTGATGAGARTIPSTVTGTVNPVNQYYPMFWQITNSNVAATIINSTSWTYGSNVAGVSGRYSANLVVGTGTSGHYAISSAVNNDYLWIATQGSGTHTFHFIAANQDIPTTPDVGPLTGTLGQGSYTSTYTIYGFSKFAAVTNLYVRT